MTENRFKTGNYESALQYTKEILNTSLSINDIVIKNSINCEKEENDNDTKDKK